MRPCLLACVALAATACVPDRLYVKAGNTLGVRPGSKRLHLVDADRTSFPDSDIYTFCRDEHTGFLSTHRTYDGACVVFFCPRGDDGTHCT